jgi:gluconate 2-dehydrogenase alpha chain
MADGIRFHPSHQHKVKDRIMTDRTMKPVDVVIVGFGWAGAIMAKELTEEGLQVLALERGAYRDTYPDGAYPATLDELTYLQRFKLFQDMSASTFTFRYDVNGQALPYRQIGAFKPGTGVGGAGLHWAGQHWRMFPEELRLRSHYVERYGAKFIPEGMTIQDFGVTYEELEPHFDFAEKVFGTSGQAYRVNGEIVGDGNPTRVHECGPRTRLSSVSGAHCHRLGALHQSLWLPDGAVQLLRILFRLRLLQLFEGLA